MPKALAIVWELIKDSGVNDEDKLKTLLKFDEVLGLSLASERSNYPDDIAKIFQKYITAKKDKNYELSDKLRAKLESNGYKVEDTTTNHKIYKL